MRRYLILALIILMGCSTAKTDNYQDTTVDAIMSNKVSKCDNLDSRDLVLTCYVAYASAKEDISVCEKIDESSVCRNRYNDLME
ncbi:hypothetical protein K9M79_06065 [Candidatus Woesearchaeota archaeon]|nr:hypothetical protein [Candidatus Woesearchaeota archaeon]